MMNKLRQENGFTLLEIIIAIAILAFGLMAIATMQVSAIKGNTHAFGLTEGAALAQDRIEQLLSLPYNDPSLLETGTINGVAGLNDIAAPDQTDPNNPIQMSDSGQLYNVCWNIAPNYPLQNTKTIRVIVTWTERSSQRRASLDFSKADII